MKLSQRLIAVFHFPVMLRAIVALMLLGGFAAHAQTPAPEALKDIARLLSQPDVRAWLDGQGDVAPTGTATASTGMGGKMSAMSSGMGSVRSYLGSLVAAVPTLPAQFADARDNLTSDLQRWGAALVASLVAGFVLVGLALDWLAHAATSGFRHWMATQAMTTPRGRIRALAGRLGYAVIMLGVFVAGTAGLFLIFDWPPLLGEIVLGYLGVTILMRAALMFGRAFLLPPQLRVAEAIRARVLPLDDATTQHWYVWIAVLVGCFAFMRTTFHIFTVLGIDAAGRSALLVPAGIIVLAAGLLAIWRRPGPDVADTAFRHRLNSWLLSVYCMLLLVLGVGGMMVAFWFALVIVALPGLIRISRHAVHYILRAPDEDTGEPPILPVTLALADRGTQILLILCFGWLLVNVAGIDLSSMGTGEDVQTRLLRAGFNALVIILGADFGWTLVKALIVHRLAPRRPVTGTGAHIPEPAEQARLLTLLPIIQNILFAVIFVIAVLMVLSTFGVDIAPLIAGAGVFGVAMGFGAQAVVKDMISGIFYMLDDAFRIGEYIQSGSYKGTVESFSIRSVRLRHHRGPIFTVPFGELGAVQNMSRDWAKDKFLISVAYDTDMEKVRKLAKKVGQDLLADPEVGANFLEPLKMKGMEAFGDYGIGVSFGMMLKPGDQQSVIRRRAFAMLKAAFSTNGVEFASPTVQVAGGDSSAAAAFAARQVMAKRALDAGAGG